MLQAFKQKWLYKDSADTETGFQSGWTWRLRSKPIIPIQAGFSALNGTSWQQRLAVVALCLVIGGMCVWSLKGVLSVLYWLFWACFMGNAAMRLIASGIRRQAPPPPPSHAVNQNLPTYSVIVALYKEAGIAAQCLQAMLNIDYPRDRLEILFALEADDEDTIAAFRGLPLPSYVRIIKVPVAFPRTKPRALNHALERARGDLVAIYDAEDRPHPGQLLEAARTFARGDASLACLQAPLRPVGGNGFIARQFAAEYAVQFDVLLPALHRLRLPFPLGGTSNHFRSDVLKTVGAWDAFNVTEDADLGLRLAQYGYTTGMITSPTWETPPSHAHGWVPQRTRWIKGYMQTLMVHTRLNGTFRPRVWLALVLGVGLSVAASLSYAPFSFLVVTSLVVAGIEYLANASHGFHPPPLSDLLLFALGTLSGMLTLLIGTHRADVKFGWRDVLSAPAYWCLQSVGAGFALYQLVVKPFHWDKTDHAPVEAPAEPLLDLAEGDPSAYGVSNDHQRHPDNLTHQSLG